MNYNLKNYFWGECNFHFKFCIWVDFISYYTPHEGVRIEIKLWKLLQLVHHITLPMRGWGLKFILIQKNYPRKHITTPHEGVRIEMYIIIQQKIKGKITLPMRGWGLKSLYSRGKKGHRALHSPWGGVRIEMSYMLWEIFLTIFAFIGIVIFYFRGRRRGREGRAARSPLLLCLHLPPSPYPPPSCLLTIFYFYPTQLSAIIQ